MMRAAIMPRMAMPPTQRSVTSRKLRQSRPCGCSSTPERASGILTRPWIRFSSCSSCCSLTELAVGLTEFGCCACAGAASATRSNKAQVASVVPSARRKNRPRDAITRSIPLAPLRLRRNGVSPIVMPKAAPSGVDAFPIRRLPAPGAGAIAALGHPLLVDLGDDLAVAGEQRLGRAHLRAERQLAFGQAVGAVLLVLRLAAVGFGAAGAVRTF